jgi:EmrB/QacA subfamily drug resistance transporter
MLVLAICCCSLLIVGLDNTIVNVALPAISHSLNAPISGLQWTIDAYTVVIASLLMLSGSTADRIGRRRVFQIGLLVFTLGSLLCSLAPGLGALIAFRAVQAVGGSMLNPVAMSIVTNTFTDPKERARAIGVWGAVFGVSMALGPVVGGALVDSVGWRGIFWINIPIGLGAWALAGRYVPESKAPAARRPDPVGQLLVIVLLGSLTYGLIEGPGHGWGSPVIVLMFVLAVAALLLLIGYERHRTQPLLDMRFFRSAPFAGATVLAVLAFAAIGGFLFVNPLYLQDVRGHSALVTGLYTLPMAVSMIVLAPIAGRIVASRGPRPALIAGGLGFVASGLLLARLTASTGFGYLFVAYALFGLASAMINPPITNSAVSGMPRAQAGVAAAVASTSRQVGQTLGVAVIGSVVTSSVHGSLHSGLPAASHVGWWIIVGCGVVVLLLGVLTTGHWARGTAARTAERLRDEQPDLDAPVLAKTAT